MLHFLCFGISVFVFQNWSLYIFFGPTKVFERIRDLFEIHPKLFQALLMFFCLFVWFSQAFEIRQASCDLTWPKFNSIKIFNKIPFKDFESQSHIIVIVNKCKMKIVMSYKLWFLKKVLFFLSNKPQRLKVGFAQSLKDWDFSFC
jgi:hypothetical protein